MPAACLTIPEKFSRGSWLFFDVIRYLNPTLAVRYTSTSGAVAVVTRNPAAVDSLKSFHILCMFFPLVQIRQKMLHKVGL